MVDIQTHKLVDMIESREESDVSAWLREYPGIRVVSRDGSRTYATAISAAHPWSIQISDRFHLIKGLNNYLTLALQKLFQGRIAIPVTEETRARRNIMLVGTAAQRIKLVKEMHKNGHAQSEICSILGASAKTIKKYIDISEKDIPAQKQTARGRQHQEAMDKLQKRAGMARTMHKGGATIIEITQKTGFTANTVRNYLADDFSSVNGHYGKQLAGKLSPFRAEVMGLKSDGLKFSEIYSVIKEKGYTGTQAAIRGFVSKERRIHQDLLSESVGTAELIDKKWLIRLLYQPIEKVKGITQIQFEAILSIYPLYKNILSIADGFKLVLKSKEPKTLGQWMARASALDLTELNSFIEGLKFDIDAVKNAIIYDYNNGLAEGFVNKIKVIKRIMYGRCKFTLLKNKCLLLNHFT